MVGRVALAWMIQDHLIMTDMTDSPALQVTLTASKPLRC